MSNAKPESEKSQPPKSEKNVNNTNTSSPPSFSTVIPEAPDAAVITFIKKYWLWIVIGIFFIWIWSGSSDKPSKSSKSSPSYSYSPSPSYSSSIYESRPMYGSGLTLNANEIYYCLAENIRIDANEQTYNEYNSVSVDRFNMTVNDYNSRCAEFRYKQSEMDAAKRVLESNKYQIEAQGRARM